MKDLYGRRINYLRISLTENCNLRCTYCKPENCRVTRDEMTRGEVIAIIKAMAEAGIKKVRFTGGEPLLRRDLGEIIAATASTPGIDDIAVTTNGTLLEDRAELLKKSGLMRINISLDTLKSKGFKEMTGGDISTVKRGIEAAKRAGIAPVKLNTVLIKGYNDDEIVDFVDLTRERDIDVRFIELMPMGDSTQWNEDKYLSSKEVLNLCPELKSVDRDYRASPTALYRLPEAKGRVGVINPLSDKFCDSCNRIRVTAKGRLKLCLHSDDEIDLLGALRGGENLVPLLREYLLAKPHSHLLDEKKYIKRNMNEIGG